MFTCRPLLFYGFDARLFPDSIDHKTGTGFHLDLETGIVNTKYNYAVALLQAPFFLGAHTYSILKGKEADGYGPAYHAAVYVAGVFYGVLGLFLLFKFFRFRNTTIINFLTVAIILLGTNLFYYTTYDTGKSHVYSFFMFSAFLWLLRKTQYLKKTKTADIVLFGLMAGWILMVRPTSIFFLAVCFFLDWEGEDEFYNRIKRLFSIKHFAIIVAAIILLWLPQLMYYKYAFGSYFYYSYSGEGFDFTDPHMLKVLFSSNNGAIIYTPLLAVIILGTIAMMMKGIKNGWIVGVLLVGLTYLFSCWWIWSFGCSFGYRSFVEYMAVFALPIAFILNNFREKQLWLRIGIIAVILICVVYNLKLTYSFDICYFGEGDTDYAWVRSILTK